MQTLSELTSACRPVRKGSNGPSSRTHRQDTTASPPLSPSEPLDDPADRFSTVMQRTSLRSFTAAVLAPKHHPTLHMRKSLPQKPPLRAVCQDTRDNSRDHHEDSCTWCIQESNTDGKTSLKIRLSAVVQVSGCLYKVHLHTLLEETLF